ncbi:complement factor I isoform X2 [Protopterus annectens]|uniref:complement factor I isoform X2 n=1 Tax=Protopterus annectens TaxID=7888 RepID=UPI001CFB8AC9|nr:complement factor I isoform X2 [Protopterus annectens]
MKKLFLLILLCRVYLTYQGKLMGEEQDVIPEKHAPEDIRSENLPAVKATGMVSERIMACRNKSFTYSSCEKVFCLPWQKCIEGTCICKLPYQCPKSDGTVCSTSGRKFQSYCQLKSFACTRPGIKFLHRGECRSETFSVSLEENDTGSAVNGTVKVKLPGNENFLPVCQSGLKITEANVICRERGHVKGAKNVYQVEGSEEQSTCLTVKCRGIETSLSECGFKQFNSKHKNVTAIECYTKDKVCTDKEFQCVNKKCIPAQKLCNGVDNCGDLSDELCCEVCTSNSFHCKSDTCIPNAYRCNGEKDCVTGEDEVQCDDQKVSRPATVAEVPEVTSLGGGTDTDVSEVTNVGISAKDAGAKGLEIISMDTERIAALRNLTTVQCGLFNNATPTRRKRLYGGDEASEGQFPWQVAIDEEGEVNCGGVYIGGCWILTAAHCVRPNKQNLYRIKVGLYNRRIHNLQADSIPVEEVIVHENYKALTYQNDIALLRIKNIYKVDECIPRSKFVSPACVPWSNYLFKAGDRCQISGWGRKEDSSRVYILRWGYIHIMPNCTNIYGSRFYDGMECAGTYDGKIDSCKGDSGGPMVCYTPDGAAYVWGLVSWGEQCGLAGYPGVYTKVAYYFDWISRHVGRNTISKYNV